jgi:hypothetical protein
MKKLTEREKTALVVIVIVMIAFTLTSCYHQQYDCAAHYKITQYYSGRVTPRYKLGY